jgi:hypothetical protein
MRFLVGKRWYTATSYARLCAPKTAKHRANIGKAITGRPVSFATRQKISTTKRLIKHVATDEERWRRHEAHLGYKHTAATRNKMSLTRVALLQQGRVRSTLGRHGVYQSVKNGCAVTYRSLLELEFYKLLEVNRFVAWYRVEPVSIPYHFEGAQHRYLPDLKVKYTDGRRELIEIKPEYLFDAPRNKAKWAAAEAYCNSRAVPITFRVIGYWNIYTTNRFVAKRRKCDSGFGGGGPIWPSDT